MLGLDLIYTTLLLSDYRLFIPYFVHRVRLVSITTWRYSDLVRTCCVYLDVLVPAICLRIFIDS
jgi:hypothetical protein